MQARARTTTAAGILAIAITVPFFGYAVQNLVLARDPEGAAIERGAIGAGIPLQSFGGVLLFIAFAMLVLCALAILVGVGVLRRRRGAREFGLFLFGLFSVGLPVALAGLAADPPASGAPIGVLCGAVNVTVLVLLSRQSTADDIEIAEHYRRERRAATRERSGLPASS